MRASLPSHPPRPARCRDPVEGATHGAETETTTTMTATLENRPQMLNGDELTRPCSISSKIDDTQINGDGCTVEEPIEADEVIWQLLKPELE
jgi:hypothetical protein